MNQYGIKQPGKCISLVRIKKGVCHKVSAVELSRTQSSHHFVDSLIFSAFPSSTSKLNEPLKFDSDSMLVRMFACAN